MRRSALGAGRPDAQPGCRFGRACRPATNGVSPQFYGQYGALSPSGDLICEDEAWREWMFRHRAPEPRSPYPAWYCKLAGIVNQGAFPGMMGGMGSLALNQLLVTMDGVDNPPFWRKFWTNRANSFFDAIYIVPRRVKKRMGLRDRGRTRCRRRVLLPELVPGHRRRRSALRPAHRFHRRSGT